MNEFTKVQVLTTINKLRLDNKGKWYSGVYDFDEVKIRVKGIDTWLQIYTVNGIDYSGIMDISVKEFKATVLRAL